MTSTEFANKVFGQPKQLSAQDERLIELYENIGITLDSLPYTPAFEQLCRKAREEGDPRSEKEIFHKLTNLRKAARLPRLGRYSDPLVNVPDSDIEVLEDLIPQFSGTMGQRDRLPYTDEFDDLAEAFNSQTGKDLTKHAIWRLVARIAK